jgi:hypothetical protein
VGKTLVFPFPKGSCSFSKVWSSLQICFRSFLERCVLFVPPGPVGLYTVSVFFVRFVGIVLSKVSGVLSAPAHEAVCDLYILSEGDRLSLSVLAVICWTLEDILSTVFYQQLEGLFEGLAECLPAPPPS